MIRRLLATVFVCVAALVTLPDGVASAHGGADTDLTSNYRTRITDVSDIAGLTASTIGLDGGIRIRWNGPGTLIVAGYEGEPYLRFDASGVATNMRSAATWINQDRAGTGTVPATVDPTADPEWRQVATTTTYQWHDHRTHWMTTVDPPQVQQDPSRSHVIYPRWEIPLTVDGAAAFIAGDLTWAPAPPLLPWLGLAATLAAAAAALLWSRWWRTAAAMLAAAGTIALTVDTAAFVPVLADTLGNKIWLFVWPAITLIATGRLAIHAHRRSAQPALSMLAAGLVFILMGGIDRFDVLTNGFYLSTIPTTTARLTTVAALGIGTAMTARFVAFLAPYLTSAARPTKPATTDEPATANDLNTEPTTPA